MTEAVNKTPHAVLLLDEIEKDTQRCRRFCFKSWTMARLLTITATVDFRNVVVIMTTNAGAQELSSQAIGFNQGTKAKLDGKHVSKAVKNSFSPEFRNRLNGIITFGPLPFEIVKMVARKFIGEVNLKLADKKVSLEFTEEAVAWVAENGYEKAYGARPIKGSCKMRSKSHLLTTVVQVRKRRLVKVSKDNKLNLVSE